MSAEEWFEGLRHAAPPGPDDVTITLDGRRLDSREAVLGWLAQVGAKTRAGRPKDGEALAEFRALRDAHPDPHGRA